jgi:hypothetical protein
MSDGCRGDAFTISVNERIRVADQAVSAGCGKPADDGIDVARVLEFELNGLDAERGGGRQERLQVLGAAAGRDRPVEQVAHLRHPGHGFFQQFDPLASERGHRVGEPRHVATGPRQVLDEAVADRIGDDSKDNRHPACCLQQRADRRGARRQNDIGRQRDQFDSMPTDSHVGPLRQWQRSSSWRVAS